MEYTNKYYLFVYEQNFFDIYIEKILKTTTLKNKYLISWNKLLSIKS